MEGGKATGEFCPGLQLVSGLEAEAPAASSISFHFIINTEQSWCAQEKKTCIIIRCCAKVVTI